MVTLATRCPGHLGCSSRQRAWVMGLTFQQREGGGGRCGKGKHSAVSCVRLVEKSRMKRTGWGEDAPVARRGCLNGSCWLRSEQRAEEQASQPQRRFVEERPRQTYARAAAPWGTGGGALPCWSGGGNPPASRRLGLALKRSAEARQSTAKLSLGTPAGERPCAAQPK